MTPGIGVSLDSIAKALNRMLSPVERIALALDRIAVNERIEHKLDLLLAAVGESREREVAMAGELDQLEQQVSNMSGVVDSAVTLLDGLKQKLDEAIASGDMSRVAAVSNEIGAKTQALADAVARDTPATPQG